MAGVAARSSVVSCLQRAPGVNTAASASNGTITSLGPQIPAGVRPAVLARRVERETAKSSPIEKRPGAHVGRPAEGKAKKCYTWVGSPATGEA